MIKLSIVWALMFALGLSSGCAQTKTTAPAKQVEFKKRIVDWGTNKSVNVKLNSGEKLDGRIADIQDQFFTLRTITGDGKVTTHEIAYSDVNKLSGKDGGKVGKVIGYSALGVLAGVGVFMVVVLAVWANN